MFFPLVFLLIMAFCAVGDTCTCFPVHPQAHYCNSDYVLLVKVNNSTIGNQTQATHRMIDVKIKKSFKANEKVNFAIKNGQIWTPMNDGVCGINLKPNAKYLITGKVEGGKAFISTCDYYQEWSNLTPKQRKGFKLLYKLGCECKVAYCPLAKRGHKCNVNANTCSWTTAFDKDGDCQGHYSICMRQITGYCQWNSSRAYKQCVKEKEQKKKERQRLEP
uniref:NTR domain-containing protein n=1 Tax=Strigamia maritima TaxID=126957 RepID=T1JNR6_STRMM